MSKAKSKAFKKGRKVGYWLAMQNNKVPVKSPRAYPEFKPQSDDILEKWLKPKRIYHPLVEEEEEKKYPETTSSIKKRKLAVIDIDRDAKFNDLNRELKGICTDIVVNDFFKSEECLYNFLLLVYSSFEDKINDYKRKYKLQETDIFFTFKGGNILRIVYKELLLELPNAVASHLKDYYKKFFKRSDADFSIYINPTLKNYDEVYDTMMKIAYDLQIKIRDIMLDNPTKYFDYFKYNNEFCQEILQKYLNDFNNANSFKDKKNYKYHGGAVENLTFIHNSSSEKQNYNYISDFIIEDGNNDKELFKSDIGNNTTPLYISLNKTLEFKSGDGGITKFALVRTKINFNLKLSGVSVWEERNGEYIEKKNSEKIINMAGELIDVSLPHRKDKSINEVFEKYDKAISRYTMNESDSYSQNNSQNSFKFNSYSLEFLIEDLEKILFHVAKFPWDDNKYVKRLNRLCYLYFLDMFIKQRINRTRINLLVSAKVGLKKTKPVVGDKPGHNVSELKRLVWYYNYVKYKAKNYPAEFSTFSENIQNNLDELLKGFKNLDSYRKSQGNLEEKKIYDTSIKQVI